MIKPIFPDRLSQSAISAVLPEPASRGAPLAIGNSQAPDFAALVDAAASPSEAVPLQDFGSAGSPPIARSNAAPALGEGSGPDVVPGPEQLPGSLLPAGGQIVPSPPPEGAVPDIQHLQTPPLAASLDPAPASAAVPSQAFADTTPLPATAIDVAPSLSGDEAIDEPSAAEALPDSGVPEGGPAVPVQIAPALMPDLVAVNQRTPAKLSASVSFAALAAVAPSTFQADAAAMSSAPLADMEGLHGSEAQPAEEGAIGGTVRLLQDEGSGGPLVRALPAEPASAGLAPGSQAQTAPAASIGSGTMAARADAKPAAELDSTIAQVIEIREALRSARPQMTLQHAEFGLVSLRLEATGAVQDWRAVLASRDPGFAPAFQAALAERALTATASTSSNSTGTGAGSGSGHGGFASQEQRYGFLPGSGQGSSLPYLAQSGQRDEGASQQHGQHHRRRDEAAPAGPHEVGRSDEREQGLFA